jgi:hypothetical protein
MATGIEPITLPWKRPEKGVSAAELGASFRIEQREDGWHCTVRVGRRSEVLVTGMRRLRDAQCRAEAHAATLPEVAAAVAEAAKAAAKGGGPVRAAAPAARSAAEPRTVPTRRRTAPPTFEQVSDGCICGKIDGGTWVADPAGKVSVPAGTDPALAQEICRVAAKHYANVAAKPAATVETQTAARTTARPAAKRAAAPKPATEPTVQRVAKRAAKPAGRRTAKRAAKTAAKAAAKTADKPATKTADKPAAKAADKPAAKTADKPAAKAADKTAAKPTAKSGRAKAANKRAAKKAGVRRGLRFTPQPFSGTYAPPGASPEALKLLREQAEAEAEAKEQQQTAAKPAATGKGRPRTGKAATAAPPKAKEEPMGKTAGKKASKSEACGCLTWAEVEGKARGEAKHGVFVIEPEGKKHALYFYDPDGQSRHLQSGEASKLRKVAEEMAARGQPAPRAVSAGDDAAMLKMFMAGAMEEET